MSRWANIDTSANVHRYPDTNRLATSLWRRYVIAVVIVAISLVASHLASLKAMQTGADASTAINIAGRQRMLSQRIMFLATEDLRMRGPHSTELPLPELTDAVGLFERSHHALMWGGEMGLTMEGATARRRIFGKLIDERSLVTLVIEFTELAKFVQSGSYEDRAWTLSGMREFGQDTLLRRLDLAVKDIEHEAKAYIEQTERISWITLLIALTILAGEILFIFRPAHRLVRRALTDLNISQEKQNRARQVAEEASAKTQMALATQSKFFGYMSHELRTPLNGIIGMLSLLQEDIPDKDRRRYLFHASSAAEHLLNMLSNVLDLSRLEVGMMSVENAPYTPTEVIETAVQLFEGQAGVKGLDLTFDVKADVPDTVTGDRARVLQIATNIIGNAVKFTDEGSVNVTLSVTGNMADTCLTVEVKDTGPRLDPSDVPHLFDDFTTAKLTSENSGSGSGLGLSISRQLVEKMGGEISAENRPGAGSQFQFSIPFEVEETAKPVPPKVHARAKDDQVFAGRNVLIVDDNETNMLIAQAYVKSLGGTTCLAADGAEAVDIFARALGDKSVIDLILMDQRMPVMDGLQATTIMRRLMKDHDNYVPILISSANISDEDHANAVNAGADSFLQKPLRREALIEAARVQFKDGAQGTKTGGQAA